MRRREARELGAAYVWPDLGRTLPVRGLRRRGLGGTHAVWREYVVITWGEAAAALLTLGILTFLLLV